jgi:phage terminase Nu1 subunit (DNA packaging protein)
VTAADALRRTGTQQELAEVLGVTPPRVSQWISEGVLPADGTLLDWVRLVVARLREQAAGRYTDGPLDLVQERAALAREQRAGLEIKNAVLRGEYASIALLSQVLATASQAVAERFDHLPGHLRKTCPRLTEDERDQVAVVIAQARNEWVRATAELVAQQLESDDEPELEGLDDESDPG